MDRIPKMFTSATAMHVGSDLNRSLCVLLALAGGWAGLDDVGVQRAL